MVRPNPEKQRIDSPPGSCPEASRKLWPQLWRKFKGSVEQTDRCLMTGHEACGPRRGCRVAPMARAELQSSLILPQGSLVPASSCPRGVEHQVPSGRGPSRSPLMCFPECLWPRGYGETPGGCLKSFGGCTGGQHPTRLQGSPWPGCKRPSTSTLASLLMLLCIQHPETPHWLPWKPHVSLCGRLSLCLFPECSESAVHCTPGQWRAPWVSAHTGLARDSFAQPSWGFQTWNAAVRVSPKQLHLLNTALTPASKPAAQFSLLRCGLSSLCTAIWVERDAPTTPFLTFRSH